MKSFSTLALIALTTVLVGCSSDSEKKTTASGNDLPVPANGPVAAAPAAQPTETLPATSNTGAVTQTTTATTATANVATVDYTVVSGDSLWKIARDHRTSVAKIKALNGLSNDKLMPGQVIKVPAAQ